MNVKFSKIGETKGTWKYAEDAPENQPQGHPGYEVVGSLYLKKPAVVSLGNPETVVLTIHAV